MLHVIPIVCVLGFFGFMEFRLSKEVEKLQKEINELKENENLLHK